MLVSGYKRIPVHMPPVAMVGNTYILHHTLQVITLFRRNGQCQRPVGRCNHTPVTVSLLHVVVITLHTHRRISKKFGIIFYGSQIGRPQNHFILHSFLVYIIAPAARSAPSAKSTRCARPSLSGGPPVRTRTSGSHKYSPDHWKPPNNNPC